MLVELVEELCAGLDRRGLIVMLNIGDKGYLPNCVITAQAPDLQVSGEHHCIKQNLQLL